MSRTRVKICCIASVEEAALAVAGGADAIGLVGAMPTGVGPIADDLIAAIARTVPPPVTSFLLTNEQTAANIAAHVARTGPGVVQIVRQIAPCELAALRQFIGATRIVQVVHVEDHGALDLIPGYAAHCDAFLLDSGRPSAAEFGGTGRVHDWTVSAAFVRASPRPVFLAGGLTPFNVAAAIRQVRPYGLDLCSGLRTDGSLDPALLSAFMAAVSAADAATAVGA